MKHSKTLTNTTTMHLQHRGFLVVRKKITASGYLDMNLLSDLLVKLSGMLDILVPVPDEQPLKLILKRVNITSISQLMKGRQSARLKSSTRNNRKLKVYSKLV